jgi:hypothetical protein
MKNIELKGPFKFEDENSIFDEITGIVNGVYLWCIKVNINTYRVYYVGEAVDIRKRMSSHLKNRLSGKYTGHDLDSLKNNIRIVNHRADEGMVPRFSHIDRKKYNQEFADNLYLFYSELPVTGDSNADKWIRCRYETGLFTHIENQGQNILSVGHLRYSKDEKSHVTIHTGSSNIEFISNQTISI